MEYSDYLNTLIAQGHYTAAIIGVVLWFLIIAVAVVVEILIIKYFIRYGINYYFKKLNAYEMDFRINELDLEIKTHNDE